MSGPSTLTPTATARGRDGERGRRPAPGDRPPDGPRAARRQQRTPLHPPARRVQGRGQGVPDRHRRPGRADHHSQARPRTWTDRSMSSASAHVLAELAEHIVDGTLRITIAAALPLADAAEAMRRSETGHTRGKIVLHR
ncbi:zinc-binding dehydrogenase [Nonomuraea sp. NPDC046802]|uniref:zinc-binding dehydrogenase n=1 Tax=Nonomuraea sp. NPDC046802 TaxID=3154919 RepID=UPI0033C262F3